MKTTHTAGEWMMAGSLDHIKVIIETPNAYALIAEVHCFDHHVPNYEEAEANARLIASAPDLLEALQSCLNWAKNGNQEHLIVFEAAQAAINKAIGN